MKKTRSDPGVLIGRGGAGGYQIYAKLLYDTIERVYRRAEGSDYMWVCEFKRNFTVLQSVVES